MFVERKWDHILVALRGRGKAGSTIRLTAYWPCTACYTNTLPLSLIAVANYYHDGTYHHA